MDSTTRSSRPENLASCFPPPPIRVDPQGLLHLGRLCVPQTNTAVFDLDGNAVEFHSNLALPQFLKTGWLTTGPLDSEIYRCVWHRVLLVGEIPEGARIDVASFTSEIPLPGKDIDEIFDQRRLTRTSVVRINKDGVGDALIQSEPGRYLWMRIQFSGDGHTSPRLKHAELEFPRITLRRYLPAVFGEEPVSTDFTDRFLALFDTTLRSIETRLDNFAGYLDPASTPSTRRGGSIDFLSWLGSWLGISFDRQWPEERRRRFLKQAGKLFPMRGTRTGLWSQLVVYLGMEPERICCDREPPASRCCPPPQCQPVVAESCRWVPPPLILEHYRLRRWLFLGMGRLQDEAVLWGRRVVNRSQLGERHTQAGQTQLVKRQDPERDPFHFHAHQFSVFVPAWVGKDDRERKGLDNLLKAESPAHAKWTIHYVEPRFRIGFQSMIGLDAVVGRYPMGVRMGEAQLDQGTILSPSPREQGTLAFRVGNATRVGSSTTLA
jgi:phage tail-like protein